MLNYKDITQEFKRKSKKKNAEVIERKFVRINGVTYKKNEIRVNSDENIPKIAHWLKNTFGGKIFINPEVKGENAPRSADLNFRNQKWEIKKPIGRTKNTIDNNIKLGKGQANNFLIDISNSTLTFGEGINQLKKVYKNPKRQYVNKVILRKGKQYIVIQKKIRHRLILANAIWKRLCLIYI